MNRSIWAIAVLSFIAGMLTVIVLVEILGSKPTGAGVAWMIGEQPVITGVSLRIELYRCWRL